MTPPATNIHSRFAVWITAIRPKTLSASIAPVVVGGAVAWHDRLVHWPALLAALTGAIAIQIGTNLANDLFDFQRGADTPERIGPKRVMQAGLATKRQMQTAIVLVFAAALIIGLYLAARGGWPIVAIGLCSIAAAILYTGGPFPIGYYGLGDVFVFVFFGPVAVVGTYYVQALSTTPTAWLSSLPMAALTTAILVVNNVRDIETDRRTGKHTLAVRIGRQASIAEYGTLFAVAAITPLIMFATGLAGAGIVIPTIVTLIALPFVIRSLRSSDARVLNSLLARTSAVLIVFALAFAIGINL